MLHLSENMGAKSWKALNKVLVRGSAEIVVVSKSALRAATEKQIGALWEKTKEEVWEEHDEDCYITIAQKSDGDLGLNKLLKRTKEVYVNMVTECKDENAHNIRNEFIPGKTADSLEQGTVLAKKKIVIGPAKELNDKGIYSQARKIELFSID